MLCKDVIVKLKTYSLIGLRAQDSVMMTAICCIYIYFIYAYLFARYIEIAHKHCKRRKVRAHPFQENA